MEFICMLIYTLLLCKLCQLTVGVKSTYKEKEAIDYIANTEVTIAIKLIYLFNYILILPSHVCLRRM